MPADAAVTLTGRDTGNHAAAADGNQVLAEQTRLLHANAPLSQLVALINAAILAFVQWAQTPIWGLLDTFSESGYVTHSGPSQMDDHEWCVAHITITHRGAQFLQAAGREAGLLYGLLSAEVAPLAAVG